MTPTTCSCRNPWHGILYQLVDPSPHALLASPLNVYLAVNIIDCLFSACVGNKKRACDRSKCSTGRQLLACLSFSHSLALQMMHASIIILCTCRSLVVSATRCPPSVDRCMCMYFVYYIYIPKLIECSFLAALHLSLYAVKTSVKSNTFHVVVIHSII